MQSRRWFHSSINGVEAERLLLEKGVDGSFLARPSRSTAGDFTLSIRRNNRVTHVRIQNSGDFYDLYGGEKFATLAELVQYYMENPDQLREQNGEIIPMRVPLNADDPTTELWYHGNMSGQYAEYLLSDQGKNGSFLVRESQGHPGNYALTVRIDDQKGQQHHCQHVIIYSENGKYDVGGGDQFDTLSELIEHYKKSPLVEKNGTVLHLKSPLNTTRLPAMTIVEQMKNPSNNSKWAEFEQLQHMESKAHLMSRREGLRPENRAKNRYKNILPFDDTRVKLMDGDPEIEGSDYINANYIKTDLLEYEQLVHTTYISTQGCLPNTVDDFWRMVWQERSRVIVMATREVERNKVKCVPYWPDTLNQSKCYGLKKEIEVTFEMEDSPDESFKIRHFRIRNNLVPTMEPRLIYQYQFVAWPDHGVPSEPGKVLNFLEYVNNCQDRLVEAAKCAELEAMDDDRINVEAPGPLIVHCSAGIGRTGTFIVIDIIINLIKKYNLNVEVDIQRTVQMVRQQRSGMVQIELQYTFVYHAVGQYMDSVAKRSVPTRASIVGNEYTNIRYNSDENGFGSLNGTPPSGTPTRKNFTQSPNLDLLGSPAATAGQAPHALASSAVVPPPLTEKSSKLFPFIKLQPPPLEKKRSTKSSTKS